MTKHRCKLLPRCVCLLPVQGPFFRCCGYYCTACGCNMNNRITRGRVR